MLRRRSARTAFNAWVRARNLARGIVLYAAPLLLAACATSTPSASPPQSSTPTGKATSEVAATPSAGGLEPRTNLPPLHDGEVDACIPGCVAGIEQPGELPGGQYQTKWFFGGYMTLSTDGGWFALEDSTGELKLIPPGGGDYGVGFALDLFPVRGEREIDPAPDSVRAWVSWYRNNPALVVAGTTETTVGGLEATRLDLSVAPGAKNDDPECPASTCVYVWGYPQWDHFNGIAGDDVYRQYLVPVKFSGTSHIFSVTVEGRDQADVERVTPVIEQLLRTVILPVAP